MPRPNRPCRHEKRACWKFTFEKKTIYFGRDIPPNERPQVDGIPSRAWEWMNEYIRQASAKVVDQAEPTVYGVGQYYLQWAENEVAKGRMAPSNYNSQSTHLEKFWSFRGYGERKARELEVEDLELFCQTMAETETSRKTLHSAAYIANLCKTVQAAFNWAARSVPDRVPKRLIPENGMKGHKPGPIPRQERYLEADVTRKFFRWVWRTARTKTETFSRFDRLTVLLLQFLRLTGSRPGEACVLLWSDINWKDGVAVIPPDRHKTGKKTGKPRVIHITPPVARLLKTIERLKDRHPTLVFTHKLGRGAIARGEVSKNGAAWNSVSLSRKVRDWREDAVVDGIPIEQTGSKRFVSYILRHSYATNAIQSGLTHAETADLIGNTAQITEQVYVHVQRKHSASRARQVVERGRGDK